MAQTDYEQRKQALEEQLQASIQFLKKGYEAQLRALEIELGQGEGAAAGTAETGEPAAAEAAPLRRRAPKSPAGALLDRVREAVAQLPDELTKEDIVRLLGFPPERSSLHRAIDVLMREKVLRIDVSGGGRRPNLYRKLSGNAEGGA